MATDGSIDLLNSVLASVMGQPQPVAAPAAAPIDPNLAAQTATNDAWNQRLMGAYPGAASTGIGVLQSMGLPNDPSLINSITNDITQNVPLLDSNPAKYFTPDAYTGGINKYQEQQRTGYTRGVNNTFAPGFEQNLLPDSSINSIVDSILGTQRGQAQQTLDFNKKRGLLNDTGYAAANQDLTGQESAGRSTLMGIGDSVLGKDRQGLLNIKGDAGNAASNYLYGSPAPDTAGAYSRAQSRAGTDLSGLEGSIRSALGGTNLFDVPTALQKGGTGQGPVNLTTAPVFMPGTDKKNTNTGRGLGSTGVF